ncbi:MAG: DEAD/DEAH box helicase family protein [Chthoniobacteraceae bacterium]
MGDREDEIYTPGTGRNGQRLNTRNYRIRPEDRVGQGSIKQKCRENFAAIEVVRRLEAEDREATDEEKRTLVRYVGWGGIPQVFAWHADESWEAERRRLDELLTPEEIEAARASTLNAHFTTPVVITAIYDAVERLGFKGGRVLEPAAGIGHFFGLMPDSMATLSRLTGVELDPISASIARRLYPDVDLRNKAFEETTLVDRSFDLAISNVPFGDYKPFDAAFSRHNFLIHDYFFAKSIEKVRPGGLMVFITSKGTLDKQNSALRHYLADHADFLGAIRLPNTAFKENANTEVTTDIVFLRRLAPGESPTGPAWIDLADHENPDGVTFRINEYFAERPEMMLGIMRPEGTMYRGNDPALVSDGRDLAGALREAIAALPRGIYESREQSLSQPQVAREPILAPDFVKQNAFTMMEDGSIAVREGDSLVPLAKLPEQTGRRIRGMIRVRDAVREVLRTQIEGSDDPSVLTARRMLNSSYDVFVSRLGPINESANLRAFDGDPDLPLLRSLEDYNPETRQAKKTAIFHERTILHARPLLAAETPKDALILSLNATGRVDLPHMERLLGRSPEQFLPELKGLVYRNPQNEQWETEDHYLSGEVRAKLHDARAAALADPTYQENVAALEAVQPVDLAASEIDARLGAVWIPADDVQAFANELLGTQGVSVSHAPQIGTWFVRGDYSAKSSVANTTDWGTGRYPALDLIQDALNLKTPTVYDPDPKTDGRILNVAETEGARDKLEKVKERFKSWLWQDDDRRERLCRKYNSEFNNIRLRVFNGSHLTLPGSSPNITLREHQKNAVWRIVQSENTLLAHAVGAGKTFTMVAAAIELKRLGLASKPMFAVPNHMLEQFSSELLALYPTANILVAGKKDFESSRRARLFSRIATGNWDAVIVTHSSFEKIPVSFANRQKFIRSQVKEIEQAIVEQKREERGTRLVKELEKVKKRLETKLKNLSADHKKDNTLTFEELGIDYLFVDEAHKFKNLFYVTKMTRVAGLPQTASERAFDLFLKVQHLQEKKRGGGVVFATGTPISNTMAEMFTMQRYLQMQELRRNMLQHFDSWAATFGETVTTMELSPDGSGYRLQSRFARFVNVPELMQQFRQTADVQTAEMLKLPVPKLESGKQMTISAPCTPELKKFVENLVVRTERIKSGKVDPRDDNMLKITTEGRKAALDLRLMLPHVRDNPNSKVNFAVEKAHDIWLGSTGKRGAQMIFCDLSTPTGNGSHFSVYADVREKLIQRGIPSEEIAFIQDYNDDAAKAALFKAVRAGTVRILLGSTPKMGEGTNVQERLIALHHLDAPWRPADIEQREGRILRQGNTNEYISIYRYVTEGSFDAYMWQTLESKSRFIAQVMNGDSSVRRAEDVDAAALTYAEVKAIASGNPLVIEKASVDAEVIRLSRLNKQHNDSQYQLRYRIKSLGESADICRREIANLQEDLKTRIPTQGDSFLMQLRTESYTDRTKAGRALVFAAAGMKPFQTTKPIGNIGGFPVAIQKLEERANIIIQGRNSYTSNVSDNALGTISSLEHAINHLDQRLSERTSDLAEMEIKQRELGKHLGQPFEYAEQLAAAAERQQRIVAQLDLTKNQAAANVDEGSDEQGQAIEEATAQRNVIRPDSAEDRRTAMAV